MDQVFSEADHILIVLVSPGLSVLFDQQTQSFFTSDLAEVVASGNAEAEYALGAIMVFSF